MKNTLFIILLLLCNFPQIIFAQNDSKFELKFGVAFSQFPASYKQISLSEIETIRINPAISTLVGISKSWSITNHLELNTGLDIHKTGTKKYSLQQDLLGTIIDYTETWEYLRMYKICFPVTMSYAFKIWYFRPLIYTGFRPNFIFSGGIDYKYHSHYRIDNRYSGVEDTYSETGTLLDPHKKLMTQYIIGFSLPLGKHIIIDLNYNLGYNYYETVYTVRGNYSTYTYTRKTSIPSCDYTISLHYKFLKTDKK